MGFTSYFNRIGEKAFPFLFSAVIPWLSILNTIAFRESVVVLEVFTQWAFSFCFLLLLWFLVERIVSSENRMTLPLRLTVALIAVIVFGTALVFAVSETFPSIDRDQPLWLSAFRLSIGGLMVVAIQGGFRAIRENEKLKTENFALQTENYKAQLDQLRNQVNPHFLFNSLSTLQTLIRKNASESEEFVHNLSAIYRQLLHSRESSVSTLEEELDFLNTYLNLLGSRHGSALQVDIEVDGPVRKLQLPSFALQLLVENCTKHNIISRDSPLHIRIIEAGGKISVSNNLQLKKSVDSTGVGLENLRKRYALMNISEGVAVMSTDAEFKVEIKLF